MLKTLQRVLLNSGVSIISPEHAARMLLDSGTLGKYKVEPSEDADAYELMYGVTITAVCEDIDIRPEFIVPSDDELDRLYKILQAPRDDTLQHLHDSRVEQELSFFLRVKRIDILCTSIRLIDQFRADNVVWGVGRGSSCASYLLFLIGVHDINPITYNIPFSEFSKELD